MNAHQQPPDVLPFTAFLADRLAADHVIVVDAADPGSAVSGGTGLQHRDESPGYGVIRPYWDFVSPLLPRLPDIDFANSVACIVDPTRPGADRRSVFDALAQLVRRCLITIIAAPSDRTEAVETELRRTDVTAVFSGVTRSDDTTHASRDTALWIVENPSFPLTRTDVPTPDDFKVIAVVIAYNEEDVIEGTIEDLVAQGAHAYVVDNWSTDRTYQLAERYLGRGVVGIEKSPLDSPPDYFDLKSLLVRLEELTQIVEGDWFIKHDADEARRSPWPGVSLRDGLWRAQLAGYNCVDFTVLNFRPVDNGFVSGSSFVDHLDYFEFGTKPGYFRQLKAWRNFGQPIDYATYGSHRIDFAGLRVFPYKFLLRHYPVRSQQHGERKIFDERQARFLPEARKRGWHTQYDKVERGQSFLADPSELEIFDEAAFMRKYVIERLSGVGVPREETAPVMKPSEKEPAAGGRSAPAPWDLLPGAREQLARVRRKVRGGRR